MCSPDRVSAAVILHAASHPSQAMGYGDAV